MCLVLPSLYGFSDVDAKESIERGANVSEWDSWLGLVPRGAYADSPVATGHIGLPELYAYAQQVLVLYTPTAIQYFSS